MNRKPDLTAEERALRDLIRQSHEAAQQLKAVIREAHGLIPTLVEQFEQHHRTEIEQLSNFITAESNIMAAKLNESVEVARREIMNQLATSEMVVDKDPLSMRLVFKPGRFDDQVPLPYPNTKSKGTNQ